MPTLTKALGQWQLPLADGVRVRTRVPGVWGSIPSQVDPITLAPNVGQVDLIGALPFLSPSITCLKLTHEDVCLSWEGYMWQNQPLGGSTALVSACNMNAYTDQSPWPVAIAFG